MRVRIERYTVIPDPLTLLLFWGIYNHFYVCELVIRLTNTQFILASFFFFLHYVSSHFTVGIKQTISFVDLLFCFIQKAHCVYFCSLLTCWSKANSLLTPTFHVIERQNVWIYDLNSLCRHCQRSTATNTYLLLEIVFNHKMVKSEREYVKWKNVNVTLIWKPWWREWNNIFCSP